MNRRLVALEFITGCLNVVGRSPDADGLLRRASSRVGLDWDAVIDLATSERVGPALWTAVRKLGLVDKIPIQAREYLFRSHLLCTLRNQSLKEQAILAIRTLNSIGIQPLLLKGGVSLFVRTYDDQGSRYMVDLDILVPPQSAEVAWNALRTQGYSPLEFDFDYTHHHHLRPLYRPGDSGTLEIHRQVLPASLSSMLTSKFVWNQIEPISVAGAAFFVPAPTLRILHNLLHAALVNRNYALGRMPLRALHELAVMQAQYEKRTDWTTIHDLMTRGGKLKVLDAWLYGAHRLFGCALPGEMRPTLGAVIHYHRTRLQIQWRWTNELATRTHWFSASAVCDRYKCDSDFLSLTKGRWRLAASLAKKSAFLALRKTPPRP